MSTSEGFTFAKLYSVSRIPGPENKVTDCVKKNFERVIFYFGFLFSYENKTYEKYF